MIERVSEFLTKKKKKEITNEVLKEVPKEIPIRKLEGKEFIKRAERNIENSRWAPQLSFCLTEITKAELDGRSPIKDNLFLYSTLAEKASSLAVKWGNTETIWDNSRPVDMEACVQIATEANRRIHDFILKESKKDTSNL